METKPMYRDASVGDRVWSPQFGWGTITTLKGNPTYPICVAFDNDEDNEITFTQTGKQLVHDINPSLFWNIFTIPSPPKPKQKVKRTVDGFINIYRVACVLLIDSTIFSSQSNATSMIGSIAGEFIVTVPISFTFEQEG